MCEKQISTIGFNRDAGYVSCAHDSKQCCEPQFKSRPGQIHGSLASRSNQIRRSSALDLSLEALRFGESHAPLKQGEARGAAIMMVGSGTDHRLKERRRWPARFCPRARPNQVKADAAVSWAYEGAAVGVAVSLVPVT
jgi:hypothetical protein